MIEITEVRVSLRNDDKLKAFVSITLNDSFVVRGLKIIRGNSGLFVAMPSRKRPDGQHQDLAHPINDVTRKYLTEIVMSEYEQELKEPTQVQEAPPAPAPSARHPLQKHAGNLRRLFSSWILEASSHHPGRAGRLPPGAFARGRTVTGIPFCWWGVAQW